MIALDTLPFGASRYPEWGTASVVGGALFVEQSPHAGALPLAVFAALGSAMVAGSSSVALRQFNGRLTARLLPEIERGSRAAVTRLQLAGLTADVIRAGAITAGLLLLFRPILAAGVQVWGAAGVLSTALVVAIAAAVAGGVVWNALPAGSQRMRVALIVGGVAAAILVG
jgi:PTS system mannose-specific IIC component